MAPSPTILRSTPLPTHPTSCPPISLDKNDNNNINNNDNRYKRDKIVKTKLNKKLIKNRVNFVLSTTPGHGVCSGMWLIYPVTLH